MKIHKNSILSLVLCLGSVSAFAQQATIAEAWFDKAVGEENTGLINGHEYHFPFRGTFSHPFFISDQASAGELLYNHQWYPDVQLMYDIFADEIILKHRTPDGFVNLISLDHERLDQFTLYNHRFRKINGTFYDVIFKGKDWELLALRKKTTKVIDSKVEFVDETIYLIFRQGAMTPMTRKSLAALCHQPHDFQVFMRDQNIRFGQKREEDIQRMAQFIEGNLKLN